MQGGGGLASFCFGAVANAPMGPGTSLGFRD